MGEEDFKKGYEAPAMPVLPIQQPIYEGYVPPNIPFAPVGEAPPPQNQPPANEKG